MKCPKCGIENEQRSVCKDCGQFLYSTTRKIRYKPTAKEKRERFRKNTRYVVTKSLIAILILLGLVLLSFLLAVGMQRLFGFTV